MFKRDLAIFFWNSICLRCFWFGLEILRLVYKKRFLKYWKVSIFFDILSSEKRVERKISFKLGVQGIKRSGILRWFEKCAEVSSLAKGKNWKTEVLGTWKILQTIVFLGKHLWELLDSRVLHIFFQLLSTPIRDGAVFLKLKAQIE